MKMTINYPSSTFDALDRLVSCNATHEECAKCPFCLHTFEADNICTIDYVQEQIVKAIETGTAKSIEIEV